MNLSIEYRRAF